MPRTIKAPSSGKFLENLIKNSNGCYFNRGVAFIDKIETSAALKTEKGEDGESILTVAGFRREPRVDFGGTLYGGSSVYFDTKESEDITGLPLDHIRQTQIDFLRIQNALSALAFVVVCSMKQQRFFRISASDVLEYWDLWQENKGKHGFNAIPYRAMLEVKPTGGSPLDYLAGLYTTDRKILAEMERRIIEVLKKFYIGK